MLNEKCPGKRGNDLLLISYAEYTTVGLLNFKKKRKKNNKKKKRNEFMCIINYRWRGGGASSLSSLLFCENLQHTTHSHIQIRHRSDVSRSHYKGIIRSHTDTISLHEWGIRPPPSSPSNYHHKGKIIFKHSCRYDSISIIRSQNLHLII